MNYFFSVLTIMCKNIHARACLNTGLKPILFCSLEGALECECSSSYTENVAVGRKVTVVE